MNRAQEDGTPFALTTRGGTPRVHQLPVWGDAFQRSLEGGSAEAVRARIQALVDFLESIQMRDAP
jgi:hypothetical protein